MPFQPHKKGHSTDEDNIGKGEINYQLQFHGSHCATYTTSAVATSVHNLQFDHYNFFHSYIVSLMNLPGQTYITSSKGMVAMTKAHLLATTLS